MKKIPCGVYLEGNTPTPPAGMRRIPLRSDKIDYTGYLMGFDSSYGSPHCVVMDELGNLHVVNTNLVKVVIPKYSWGSKTGRV